MYVTNDDIKMEFTDKTLSDLLSTTGNEIDINKLNQIIDTVNMMIDDALRNRYKVPLSIIPATIKSIAISLACYKIHETRKRVAMPQSLKDSWDMNMSLLNQYQNGKLLLDVEPVAIAPRGVSKIVVRSRSSVFNNLDY